MEIEESRIDMESGSAVEGIQRIRSSAAAAAADTRGKHRISAELKRIEQETRFLEEELEQLEKMEAASTVCKDITIAVETKSDPLLPATNGPTNPAWDRWFEGPKDKRGCRCCIL